MRATYIVHARYCPLQLLSGRGDYGDVTEEINGIDTRNVQDHARKTETPVVLPGRHAVQEDYTAQANRPASKHHVSGSDILEEWWRDKVADHGSNSQR